MLLKNYEISMTYMLHTTPKKKKQFKAVIVFFFFFTISTKNLKNYVEFDENLMVNALTSGQNPLWKTVSWFRMHVCV